MSGPQLYQKWNGEKTRKFRRLLLDWYGRNRRKLPWRADPGPYRVWIAEVMLQQTRVSAVLPYYERFVARFPDVNALAAAPEEEVLKAWAGLGYYSRARNLMRAARRIAGEFGGNLPSDIDILRTLPGIGRYTAGAICSIAFNQPQPIVDGNVRRVITRLEGIASLLREDALWERAAALVPSRRAADFNQALMELGALVCVPVKPLCASCPVQSLCAARARGLEHLRPATRRSRAMKTVRCVILVAECDGRVLLTTQDGKGFVPGKWCLPSRLLKRGESAARAANLLAAATIGNCSRLRAASIVRHSITWRRILAHVFCAEARDRLVRCPHMWVERSTAVQSVTSSLYSKILRQNLKADS